MASRGQRRPDQWESRTRSFRQSFLVAYASRIGARLRGATEAAAKDVADDATLLPVLRAQSERVHAACEEIFPHLYSRSVNVTNGAGWSAGRAAADLALFDVATGIPASGTPQGMRVAS